MERELFFVNPRMLGCVRAELAGAAGRGRRSSKGWLIAREIIVRQYSICRNLRASTAPPSQLQFTSKPHQPYMPNLPIGSREYKLMLNVDRFQDRPAGCDAFLALIEHLLRGIDDGISMRRQNKDDDTRKTSYLDTAELALSRRGLALRLRREADGQTQLNLKFRSPDRYLAADNEVFDSGSGALGDAAPKFEEDIVPPFLSRFSRSLTITTELPMRVGSLEDAISHFPGLKTLDLGKKTRLNKINGFEVHEVVRKLCNFRFGKGPAVKSCLSFWYSNEEHTGWPLVAEFSFDYDAEESGEPNLETFSTPTVSGAKRLFQAIQLQAGWLNSNLTTKTAFAQARV